MSMMSTIFGTRLVGGGRDGKNTSLDQLRGQILVTSGRQIESG